MNKESEEKTISAPDQDMLFENTPAGLGLRRKERAETMLSALREKERELQSIIEKQIPDDEEFYFLMNDIEKHLHEAKASHRTGTERAQALALARKLMEKIEFTGRGKASMEFMKMRDKRQEVEDEVLELHRMVRP